MDAQIVDMHQETHGNHTTSVLHIATADGKQSSVRVQSIAGQKIPHDIEGKSWAVRLVMAFLRALDTRRLVN